MELGPLGPPLPAIPVSVVASYLSFYKNFFLKRSFVDRSHFVLKSHEVRPRSENSNFQQARSEDSRNYNFLFAGGFHMEWLWAVALGFKLRMEELSVEALNRLKCQEKRGLISEFQQDKLERESAKNWDKFYKRNENRFFKDRHWTTREFEELLRDGLTLLEVGCGVGNFFYPLLELGSSLKVHACDFSSRAIDLVRQNALYDETKINAFVCDITKDALQVEEDSVDLVSLVFVLSAILPSQFGVVLEKLFRVLRPGGSLIFRDYGVNDMAMIRFGPGSKLADRLYARQDGTRAYYFTVEELNNLFVQCGFEVVENGYVKRETVNRKEGLSAERIFVQTKCRKPLQVMRNESAKADT